VEGLLLVVGVFLLAGLWFNRLCLGLEWWVIWGVYSQGLVWVWEIVSIAFGWMGGFSLLRIEGGHSLFNNTARLGSRTRM
jgi:hypothetical protein